MKITEITDHEFFGHKFRRYEHSLGGITAEIEWKVQPLDGLAEKAPYYEVPEELWIALETWFTSLITVKEWTTKWDDKPSEDSENL